MRRFFVAGNLFVRLQNRQLLFDGFKTLLKAGDVLLLTVNFLVEVGDGFVLQRGKGFQLNNAFFHGGKVADYGRMGSGFAGFSVEAR